MFLRAVDRQARVTGVTLSRRALVIGAGLLPAARALASAEDRLMRTRIGDVEVALWLPGGGEELRGLYVHAANYELNPRDRWAESARRLRFGHLALRIKLSDRDRVKKMRAALDQGLEVFARQTGRLELPRLPLAGAGHSAGGLVTKVLLSTPGRVLTTAVDCGWIIDPATIDEERARIPMLFSLGAIPDDFKMLPQIESRFVPARRRSLPWALALKWDVAHDYANAAALTQPWLEAVARVRLPASPGAVLNDAGPGWLGDRRTIESELPVIMPAEEWRGDKSGSVWLPDRAFAHVWRSFQAKAPAVQLHAFTPDKRQVLPAPTPKAARSLLLEAGERLVVGAEIVRPDAMKRIDLYDGDRRVGEVTKGRRVWRPETPGTHVLYLQYDREDGTRGVSSPALVTVRDGVRDVVVGSV